MQPMQPRNAVERGRGNVRSQYGHQCDPRSDGSLELLALCRARCGSASPARVCRGATEPRKFRSSGDAEKGNKIVLGDILMFPDPYSPPTPEECEARRLEVVQTCNTNPAAYSDNQFIPASFIVGPLFCTASKMGMTDCNRSLYIGGAVIAGIALLMLLTKR